MQSGPNPPVAANHEPHSSLARLTLSPRPVARSHSTLMVAAVQCVYRNVFGLHVRLGTFSAVARPSPVLFHYHGLCLQVLLASLSFELHQEVGRNEKAAKSHQTGGFRITRRPLFGSYCSCTSKVFTFKAPMASPARLPDPFGSLLMLVSI